MPQRICFSPGQPCPSRPPSTLQRRDACRLGGLRLQSQLPLEARPLARGSKGADRPDSRRRPHRAIEYSFRAGATRMRRSLRVELRAVEPLPHGHAGPLARYDPLAVFIAEGRKRGISIHAWINPYRAATNERLVQPQQQKPRQPPRRQHPPSWAGSSGSIPARPRCRTT